MKTDTLETNEKILFTGLYDTKLRNVQNNISTLPCEISINKHGYNIRSSQWNYVNDKANPNNKFLLETYTLSSFDKKNNKIGQINWSGFYPDATSQGGITTNGIQNFVVLGSDGIYKKVKKVIIDFSDTIRKLYFIKIK
jgi:hypothetical protein